MSDARLNLHAPTRPDADDRLRRPLGRHLVETGKINAAQLIHALELQEDIEAPLGEILMSQGLISQGDIMQAVAAQNALYEVDLLREPADATLAELAHRSIWLRHACLPWVRLGNTVLIACERPDRIEALRADLPAGFPEIIAVVAKHQQIVDALAHTFRPELTAFAQTRTAPEFSCRHWTAFGPAKIAAIALILCLLATASLLAPQVTISALSVLAVVCLFLITLLKLSAGLTQLAHQVHATPPAPHISAGRWPRISIMVPLFRETEVAGALVRRLQRLTYPKVLLDVILVLEEKDTLTPETLAACDLPAWMRVVEVPDGGGITTKPRALNYALDFCRGEFIGIWDAEDAPAPDQLQHVAAHFARAAPDVACLQGILDYYNPRANWISRCFTIEYASWFRVILPGLARLGLVIPLGGTTLFLRRDKIHEMGGWDAHNVTEDADLGVRIARFGYRTEVIGTATHEEANCRPWHWVKQRSRWLKGFMVTYCVHMRHPRRLLADLGWKRFLGFQAFFVGTLSQFLLAPVLWTFWLHMLALPHATLTAFGGDLLMLVGALFITTELVNLGIALFAVSGPRHRFLIHWTLTMPLYFPLGALASYKALYELLVKPFYWDKTQHGQSHPDAKAP